MHKEGKTLKAELMIPRFTALHPALRGSHAENKSQHKRTKGTKNQRVKPPHKPALLIPNATN